MSCSLHVKVCFSLDGSTFDEFSADEVVAGFVFCRANKVSVNFQL